MKVIIPFTQVGDVRPVETAGVAIGDTGTVAPFCTTYYDTGERYHPMITYGKIPIWIGHPIQGLPGTDYLIGGRIRAINEAETVMYKLLVEIATGTAAVIKMVDM